MGWGPAGAVRGGAAARTALRSAMSHTRPVAGNGAGRDGSVVVVVVVSSEGGRTGQDAVLQAPKDASSGAGPEQT